MKKNRIGLKVLLSAAFVLSTVAQGKELYEAVRKGA
jgi:hypothetical protein